MEQPNHLQTRHNPSDGNEQIFLPHSEVQKATQDTQMRCSVLCSSSCRDMSDASKYTPYKLFSTDLHKLIKWPKSTSTCCWYCCHAFETVPVCIPVTYDTLQNVFEVFGIFCSWNCAKAYVQSTYSSESSEQLMWMRIMAREVFQTNLGVFSPAPPRMFLKMFGGHLTIEEFRAKSICAETVVLTPPLVSYPIVLQENMDVSNPTNAGGTMEGITPSSFAGRVIGLRRPPPASQDESRTRMPSCTETGLYEKFIENQQQKGTSGTAPSPTHSKGGGKKQKSSGKQRKSGTLAGFIRSRE